MIKLHYETGAAWWKYCYYANIMFDAFSYPLYQNYTGITGTSLLIAYVQEARHMANDIYIASS